MSSELVLNSTPGGVRIALLEDKKLNEYHLEELSQQFNVGDIYLGAVSKIMPGLNAAFIDIGSEKDGFLHYFDLGPQFATQSKFTKSAISGKSKSSALDQVGPEKDIEKTGKIKDLLQKNYPVLVQVLKEPISSKGPRLCCEISLAGRFIVLVPFTDTISVSKKISNGKERNRLREVIAALKPKNFGVIIRTIAENKSVSELESDLVLLLQKWDLGFKKLKNAKPREKIIGEINRTSSILRDLLNEDFDNIVVDNTEIFEEIKTYISTIAPDKLNIVNLHTSKQKIFESLGIEKQLKASFGKSVMLPNGGYLIIEHTEAMHVVDVNSGHKANVEGDQEATALNVNLDAAKEVGRQLRLRDIGGIIIIDFIDLRSLANRKILNHAMMEELKKDRTRSKVLPLSKFGLMQITRQRVRPETFIKTSEVCPTCNGTGNIMPTLLITDEIQSHLEHIILQQNENDISIIVHPFLHAFFTKGVISRQMKWWIQHHRWVKIVKDSSFAITQYSFLNKSKEVIEV